MSFFGTEHAHNYRKLDGDIVATLRTVGFAPKANWTDRYLVMGMKLCLSGFVLQLIGVAIYHFDGKLYIYTVNAYPEKYAKNTCKKRPKQWICGVF